MTFPYESEFAEAIRMMQDCIWIWNRDNVINTDRLSAMVGYVKYEFDRICREKHATETAGS